LVAENIASGGAALITRDLESQYNDPGDLVRIDATARRDRGDHPRSQFWHLDLAQTMPACG
jgi:hypothetical protein